LSTSGSSFVPLAKGSFRSDNVPEPGAIVRPPLFTSEELVAFKAQIAPLIGVDLDAYKPRQIERRITALLCRAGAKTLLEFSRLLEGDAHSLAEFVDGLTINVSEFFRNPEKWEELVGVLDELLGLHARLKIWSAGCSMGAELYSVGILLAEMKALDRVELVGTDLDRGSLAQAALGLYGAHELKSVSPERLARYFRPEGARFRFEAPQIQARTRFAQRNLLVDAPEADCHLILCRNVVIYLNEASKLHLYRGFHQALVPGGVLFVGGTERIFTYRELGYDARAAFFYQKPAADLGLDALGGGGR
jgi:chemotaxis protein methyltransferase CheR